MVIIQIIYIMEMEMETVVKMVMQMETKMEIVIMNKTMQYNNSITN